MNTISKNDVEFFLQRALVNVPAEIVVKHRWLFETDRWNELVVSLLKQVISMDENRIRTIVGYLSNLDLIDIELLASLYNQNQGPDFSNPTVTRIKEFLEENNVVQAEINQSVIVLCELSYGFQTFFDSKVQLYLRHYGELILKELGSFFHFSNLSESEVVYAFTYWLQNVLNMPVSLVDAHMKVFCKDIGTEPDVLISAADDLDLNMALLDDVIQHYILSTKNKKKPKSKKVEEKN